MKKLLLIFIFTVQFAVCSLQFANAQCSICTKTASQLGEKPAKGLNAGIIYLMLAPFAVATFIGFRWWQKEKHNIHNSSNDM